MVAAFVIVCKKQWCSCIPDSPAPWEGLVWDRGTWQALSTCQMSGASCPFKEELLAKPLGCDVKERGEWPWDGAKQPDKARVLTGQRERWHFQGELRLPIMQ